EMGVRVWVRGGVCVRVGVWVYGLLEGATAAKMVAAKNTAPILIKLPDTPIRPSPSPPAPRVLRGKSPLLVGLAGRKVQCAESRTPCRTSNAAVHEEPLPSWARHWALSVLVAFFF